MSIATNADHQLLLYNGGKPTSFLRNKNRLRESQRSNTFGLERTPVGQPTAGGAHGPIPEKRAGTILVT